jgi:hypothetical protein
MAWLLEGKHFGGYTYAHWFDDDTSPGTGEGPEAKTQTAVEPSADAGASAGPEDGGRAGRGYPPHGSRDLRDL